MTPAARQFLPRWLTYSLLALILLAGFALHLDKLGHPGIRDLDEAFHAIVARSMVDHPFSPTLYATAYLPYDYRNWQQNHIWLHKPPMALWQIATSFAVFGESNFTLRLPSLLLSTGATALTFLIGRSLVSADAGLVAALLQSLSIAITRLVHGQVFSDHVDVAMLFWCEVGVLLLIRAAQSGKTSHAAVAGIAQAIAWLTKSYPAGFLTLLAILLFAWPREIGFRISGRQLLAFILAATITAAPWTIWCLVKFPREFLWEQLHAASHLYGDVESFGVPWDLLVFDYLSRAFLEFYPLAIAAVAIVTFDGVRRREGRVEGRRDARRLFIAAWWWFVFIPHCLAASKTPTATLIGWPAAWLAIGVVVSDALRRRPLAIVAILVAAILLIVWPQLPGASALPAGTKREAGAVALQHWPIAASTALILLTAFAARAVGGRISDRHWRCALIVAGGLMIWPLTNHVRRSIRASNDAPADALAFPKLGEFVRNKSPKNAVFLVDAQERGEALVAMWWLDRACYTIREETLADAITTIAVNGGEPFILSRRQRPEKELPGVIGEARIYVPAIGSALPPATSQAVPQATTSQ